MSFQKDCVHCWRLCCNVLCCHSSENIPGSFGNHCVCIPAGGSASCCVIFINLTELIVRVQSSGNLFEIVVVLSEHGWLFA